MALRPMHLRLESENGRDGEEYRICDGHVEFRSVGSTPNSDEDNCAWRRVTPQQLIAHVNGKTVLAECLKKRLGWRRLLRACAEEHLYMFDEMTSNTDRRAA